MSIAAMLLLRPQIDDATTRREFIGILVAAGLVAGCSSDAPAADDEGAATRAVEDAFGESVDVPVDPRHVVVLDPQVLGNLLKLGFPADRIVGFAKGDFADLALLDYLGDPELVESLPDVGTYAEPNIEAIVVQRPDLILIVAEEGFDDFYDPIFESLAQVDVPVFAAFNGYKSLDDSMRLLADVGAVVGRTEEAGAVEAALRAEVQRVVDAAAETGPLPTAAFLRVTPENYSNTVMPLLDEMGIPGRRPTAEEFSFEISLEELGQFDHDVLFVSDGDDPEGTTALLESNPLYARLPAVERGDVHLVSDAVWGAGYSVLAYERQLADIAAALGVD